MLHVNEAIFIMLWNDKDLTKRDIARKLSCCYITVDRIATRLKLSPRKTPKKIDNITNNIYGKLTAVDYVGNDNFGKALWIFACDCGKRKKLNASAVKAGLTKSCGCYKINKSRSKSVGQISSGFWHRLERSALSRNYKMTITTEEAWEIFKRQGEKCAISGVKIVLYPDSNKEKLQTASPDRINANLGYTLDNFQWVHKRINRMKNILSVEELIFWSRKIAINNEHVTIQEYDTRILTWGP